MTAVTYSTPSRHGAGPLARTGASRTTSIAALAQTVFLWARVAEERRALAALDADRLTDIGVSRAAASDEARRPFWRLDARR